MINFEPNNRPSAIEICLSLIETNCFEIENIPMHNLKILFK